jgi:hypothetical protein
MVEFHLNDESAQYILLEESSVSFHGRGGLVVHFENSKLGNGSWRKARGFRGGRGTS